MTTSALIMMLVVQITVTAVTARLLLKTFKKNNREKEGGQSSPR